jgi:hypothetical protein
MGLTFFYQQLFALANNLTGQKYLISLKLYAYKVEKNLAGTSILQVLQDLVGICFINFPNSTNNTFYIFKIISIQNSHRRFASHSRLAKNKNFFFCIQ